MERYLLSYLKDYYTNPLAKKWIDYMKVDLDGFLYAYGENMNLDYPMSRSVDFRFYKRLLRNIVKTEKGERSIDCQNNVLSFVGLPSEFIKSTNLNVLGSIVQPVGEKIIYSKKLIESYLFYSKLIKETDFNRIFSDENIKKLEKFKNILLDDYSKYNFKALFVGNGEPFMFKLHLDIFKDLKVPSFIFLHGLPGIYKLDTEKRADYLLVWGDQIKKNYIDAGFEPDRIIVTGHPEYKEMPKLENLRNDFSNVLVITTSSVDWSPHGWEAAKFPIYDRSRIVLYAYSIQHVLQRNGVHKARLRVHPSVNKDWIMKYVDDSFYTIDNDTLKDSLNQSSLLIGPTSTMWLNSILEGVNYLIYEPISESGGLVPPFDGSDKCVKVAISEDELNKMLEEKYILDLEIIDKYVKPFNSQIVSNYIPI